MTHSPLHPPDSPIALVLYPQILGAKSMQHLLRQLGITRVSHAQTWPEALQVLGAEPVQLVLTPWSLPGLEGPALLRALCSRSRGRVPHLILLDEGLPRQTIVAAVKHGVAGRVILPASLAGLREALRQVGLGGATDHPVATAAPDPGLPAAARRAPARD